MSTKSIFRGGPHSRVLCADIFYPETLEFSTERVCSSSGWGPRARDACTVPVRALLELCRYEFPRARVSTQSISYVVYTTYTCVHRDCGGIGVHACSRPTHILRCCHVREHVQRSRWQHKMQDAASWCGDRSSSKVESLFKVKRGSRSR